MTMRFIQHGQIIEDTDTEGKFVIDNQKVCGIVTNLLNELDQDKKSVSRNFYHFYKNSYEKLDEEHEKLKIEVKELQEYKNKVNNLLQYQYDELVNQDNDCAKTIEYIAQCLELELKEDTMEDRDNIVRYNYDNEKIFFYEGLDGLKKFTGIRNRKDYGFNIKEIVDLLNDLYEENNELKNILIELGLLKSEEEVVGIRQQFSDKILKKLFENEGWDVDIDCEDGFNIIVHDNKED